MENSEGKLALQSRDLKIETPTKHWNRMQIFKKFLVWEPFLFFSRLSFQMFLCFFLSGCAGSLLLDTGFLQSQWVGATLLFWCTGFSCGVSSIVTEHWLLGSRASVAATCMFSSCDAWAQLLLGVWDLPGAGVEPMSLHCRQILYHWTTREVLEALSECNPKLRIHRNKSDHEKIKFRLLQNIKSKASLENIFRIPVSGKELYMSFIYKK